MKFNRFTEMLDSALLHSSLAQAAIQSGIEIQPAWGNGAKIFVDGVGPQHFEAPVMDEELRPWHVVLHEANVIEVEEAIAHLPYRFRSLKSAGATLPCDLSLCQ